MTVPEETRKEASSLMGRLIEDDPLGKTQFEVSFKVADNLIPSQARFLNMDSNAYSCKNKLFFLERVELYKRIMAGKTRNPLFPGLMRALGGISQTPMDLYFGADVSRRNLLFAFWLIFGGVKRSGEISFWPYDFERIVKDTLGKIRFKGPGRIGEDILNFGFDIDDKNVFYKIYFLCREKVLPKSHFTDLMKRINRNFLNFKYFYFISQMYDKNGKCIKEKLFTEFLESIYPGSKRQEELLAQVIRISKSRIGAKRLFEIVRSIGGRLSLISFENNGTLTFYIRI